MGTVVGRYEHEASVPLGGKSIYLLLTALARGGGRYVVELCALSGGRSELRSIETFGDGVCLIHCDAASPCVGTAQKKCYIYTDKE